MRSRRFLLLTLLGIGTLLLLFGLTALHNWFYTATITISTSPNAEIYVRQTDPTLRKLGTGKAVLKTKSTESVFVEVREDDRASQKDVTPKRRQNINVKVDIKALGTAQRIIGEPFIFPLIQQGLIYGINPYTNYLDAAPLAGNNATQLPHLPFLPMLRQVAWHDSQNFIYATATEGSGVVSSQPGLTKQDLPYTIIATPDTSTTALVSSKGLHLAQGLNIENAPLVASSRPDTFPFLFADERYIFFGWTVFEPAVDEGGRQSLNLDETEEEDPGIENAILSVFDHKGKQLEEITIPTKDRVFKVLSEGESRMLVLAGDGLYIADANTGAVQKKEFSFGRAQDMLRYDGRTLLLGPGGLWEYDVENDTYYKSATYPTGEAYIPNSLTILGDKLYFSTSVKEGGFTENQNARNSVYEITLKD